MSSCRQPGPKTSRTWPHFGYRQVLDRTLGELFVVRGRVLVHLDPDRRVSDVLRGLWRGRAGVLLDVAAGVPGPVHRGLCFAELAAHYPLSGGVYQWSRWIGSGGVGWMAGWVYLSGSVISLAAVALALAGDSSADRAGVSIDR